MDRAIRNRQGHKSSIVGFLLLATSLAAIAFIWVDTGSACNTIYTFGAKTCPNLLRPADVNR